MFFSCLLMIYCVYAILDVLHCVIAQIKLFLRAVSECASAAAHPREQTTYGDYNLLRDPVRSARATA